MMPRLLYLSGLTVRLTDQLQLKAYLLVAES
jgi:hypothetical protein